MVFNKKGAAIRNQKFYHQNQGIEVVDQCTYLRFTLIQSDKKHQGIENFLTIALKKIV